MTTGERAPTPSARSEIDESHPTGMGRSPGCERALLTLVLALIYLVYVVSSFGLVSSNDGSHFAVTRALVERGEFRFDDEIVFALNDVAAHEGNRYSNKPPGTGILAVPFYWIAGLAGDRLHEQPDEVERRWLMVLLNLAQTLGYDVTPREFSAVYDATRPERATTMLLVSAAGVFGLWMFYRCSRRLGASAPASFLGLLALALGSVYWRYSTALFAHVISAAMLMLQFEWLVSGRAWRSRSASFCFGLLVGAAVAVEYQAALSLPFLGLAWIGCGLDSSSWRDLRRRLTLLGLGALLPLAALAWYQYASFGNPLRTAQVASEHFDYARSMTTMLAGNFAEGMHSMLFSARSNGLLRVSPIVFVALVGWFCWPAKQRRLLAAALCILIVHCAILFHIMAPEGGATEDHRYLVRILPLLLLPTGLAFDHLRDRSHPAVLLGGFTVAGVLLAASVAQNFELMTVFMKHQIRLPPSTSSQAHWEHLAGLSEAAFPSAGNWPLLVLAGLVYLPLALAAWWALGREASRS